jgi:hypothetical protein
MANGLENIKSQTQEGENEISKILGKITFNCPHCYKEINETHLDEKGRYFQTIKEKIRRTTEEVLNSQKDIQKKHLLEQIKTERSYEKFGEVIKRDTTIEELTKTTKKQEEEILELKLKFKGDLAKATSYDEIRKLEGFKELEGKVGKYQKEIEELKLGNQPEIQKLKEIIKKLEKSLADKELQSAKDLAKATSADAVNELKVVKELKEQLVKFQEENEKLKEKNQDLIISKSKDSQRKGEDFEK